MPYSVNLRSDRRECAVQMKFGEETGAEDSPLVRFPDNFMQCDPVTCTDNK